MRKLRLRFREFLLLTVLTSLITAAFAIRARMADREVAHGHAARAYRVRVEAKYLAERIEFARRKLEIAPILSQNWADECDLRLMPSVIEAGDLPAEGKDLVVVAEFNDSLWFRGSTGPAFVSSIIWSRTVRASWRPSRGSRACAPPRADPLGEGVGHRRGRNVRQRLPGDPAGRYTRGAGSAYGGPRRGRTPRVALSAAVEHGRQPRS